MRIGQQVVYEDAKGKRQTATVTAIAGSGSSGNKTLDLALEAGEAKNVPHGEDREPGKGFWQLEGEVSTTRAPGARRKKREK